jgi:Fic family protein
MSKSSTKPKGETSYKETAFGIIPRTRLIKLELKGTKKGLDYLHDLVQQKIVVITPNLVLKLHEISFSWIFPKWAGKYRTIQVTFSDKEAPPYYQVSELVLNLIKDLELRLKHLPRPDEENFIFQLVSLLAWFQHRFVFIHPFQDYNGRTARMLTTLILLQLKLPPIELKADTEEDRKKYLLAMQNADEGNFDLLEKLIGYSLTESLKIIQK